MQYFLSILLAIWTTGKVAPTESSLIFKTLAGTGIALGFVALLEIAGFLLSMILLKLLGTFRRYVDEHRVKRAPALRPVLIWGGRLASLISRTGSRTMRLIRSEMTEYYHGRGDWPRTLASASKEARKADRITKRINAYNAMLESMAMLNKREAFAITFASLESTVEKLLTSVKKEAALEELNKGLDDDEKPNKGKASATSEADVFRLLYWGNYWRAVMAFRAADFADARHWLTRAAQLDPRHPGSHLLAAEIFALEGKDEKAFEKLRAARKSAELDAAYASEMRDLVGSDSASTKAEPTGDLKAIFDEIAKQARSSVLWSIAWTEIKCAFWLEEAARLAKALSDNREHGETNISGKLQILMAETMYASMKREGNKAEAPYAKAIGTLRFNPIAPHVRMEIPLLRGVAQYYRRQPEAALKKFDEIMTEPEWMRPPLVEAIVEAHRALCLEKLGRAKEGKLHHLKAGELMEKGSRLRAQKLAKKATS